MASGKRRSKTAGPQNVLPNVSDDGLRTARWKPHTRDKLLILGYYLEQFTVGMRRFPNLVFVDLFAGPGRGRFPSGRFMEGSPLIAARTPRPFTKLVLVEESKWRREALERRLERDFPQQARRVIPGDCNAMIDEVLRELPDPTSGLLTFCFIDPFGFQIHFSTLHRLSFLKIDFLVLVPDQMAGARDRTLLRPEDRRIERFLDDPSWREKWTEAKKHRQLFRDFLLNQFTKRMVSMNFLAGEAHRVKVAGGGAFLYRLAYFSKSPRGIAFWDNARRNAPDQKQMEFE
jgi:three-Cys-motif partner protein